MSCPATQYAAHSQHEILLIVMGKLAACDTWDTHTRTDICVAQAVLACISCKMDVFFCQTCSCCVQPYVTIGALTARSRPVEGIKDSQQEISETG